MSVGTVAVVEEAPAEAGVGAIEVMVAIGGVEPLRVPPRSRRNRRLAGVRILGSRAEKLKLVDKGKREKFRVVIVVIVIVICRGDQPERTCHMELRPCRHRHRRTRILWQHRGSHHRQLDSRAKVITIRRVGRKEAGRLAGTRIIS